MEPYWQGKYSTLYLGDAFEIMPKLPPKSADLLCVDPPYGMKWRSRQRDSMKKFSEIKGDDGTFDLRLFGEQATKLIDHGQHMFIFGFRPDQIPETFRIGGSCELIWDKGRMGSGDLSSAWGPQHEVIAFGTYIPSKADRRNGRGNLSARLRQGSILRFNAIGSTAIRHPTEKPVPLMRALIESSTILGGTVIDPCAGIGSTLVAATLEGRFSIGIEIEEEYCEIAAIRLKHAESFIDEIKKI